MLKKVEDHLMNIKKSGIITICGRPNVGKSTLTNTLAGEKVAIVSPKPQTTRNRICAVLNRGDSQFVFVDTPGLHKARTRLGDYMVKVVRQSVADVDGVMLLVEPVDRIGKPEEELIARIKAQLRRYKKYNVQSGSEEQILTHSGLVLNVDTHECFLNEKPLDLTPTEFSILSILCRRKGTVVSSEELFHEIWGEKYFSKSNNTITVHIRHLREKMGDSFEHPNYIKTVWGCGYKIEK